MTPLEQHIIAEVQTLPLDKQQEVLDFVQFLKMKLAASGAISPAEVQEQPISVLEATGEYIGYVETPVDLPNHEALIKESEMSEKF